MKLERYGLSTLVARNGILYPETGDFVAESRLFPDTKYPVSGTSVDRPLHAGRGGPPSARFRRSV